MTPYQLPFDPTQLPIIGHFGGVISGIAVREPFVYVGTGAEFAVLDAADPKQITRIGSLILDGVIQEVCLAANYALVTVSEGADGLYILDVAQPAAPVQVGFYPLVWARRVTMSAGYAYIAAIDSELHIVDISDPTQPKLANKINFPQTDTRYPRVWAVTIAGRYAYIEANDLHIFDVTNPVTPAPVGIYPIHQGDGVAAIRVREPYAYLATNNEGLVILDISDPTSPQFVSSYGSYETQGFTCDVALVSHYAYVFSAFEMVDGFFQVVDLAAATQPVMVSRNQPIGTSLVITADYGYVPALGGGLHVLDLSYPAAPTEAGQWLAPGTIESVALTDQFVYISGGWHDFHIADLSRPESPIEVAYFRSPNYIRQIIARGTYAYLVEGACTFDGCTGGLRIVDMAVPSHPVEAGYWGDTTGEAEAAVIVDNTVCVYWAQPSDSGAEEMIRSIRLLEVSDPARVREVATYPLLRTGINVEIMGQTIHLSGGVVRESRLPTSRGSITYVPTERRGLYMCRGLPVVTWSN